MSEDYGMFLKAVGMTDLEVQLQMNTNVIINTTMYQSVFRLDQSLIPGAGLGVFTKRSFEKGEFLGIAVKVQLKTMLGRFVNHSSIPNIEFNLRYDCPGLVYAFALRYINKNEELLVNYLDNYRKLKGEIK